jgi:uncharacterized membrane protein HdeD (DUF308 family)
VIAAAPSPAPAPPARITRRGRGGITRPRVTIRARARRSVMATYPVEDLAAQADTTASEISGFWWLWLVTGIIWIVVAVTVLQFDQASVTTVGVIVGVMFLFSAVQQFIVFGLADGGMRWLALFFGVLLGIAGIFALFNPENTFAGVADVLGFLFLLVGGMWIVQALIERDANDLWWLGLISGILMVILAFWTGGQFLIEKAYMLLVFAGIWALMHGVTDIVRAFQVRRLHKELT